MDILIVNAHRLELEPFKSKFDEISSFNIGHGKAYLLNGLSHRIFAVRTGIGLENAGSSLEMALKYFQESEMNFAPEFVMNFGLGGAIHPERRIGDLVIGLSVVSEEQPKTPVSLHKELVESLEIQLSNSGLEFIKGIIYSSNKAISDERTRHSIYERTGAQVVDMECHSIANICDQFNLKFSALKYISDNADEFVMKDFLASFNEGTERLGNVVYDFISSL